MCGKIVLSNVADFSAWPITDFLACLWIDLYTVISLQKEKIQSTLPLSYVLWIQQKPCLL